MISLGRLCGEQNHRCCYCGVRMLFRHESCAEYFRARSARDLRLFNRWRLATRDHYVPECFGGGDGYENMIAACEWCNNYRGNIPAREAMNKIGRLVYRGSHPHVAFLRTGVFNNGFNRPPTRIVNEVPFQ